MSQGKKSGGAPVWVWALVAALGAGSGLVRLGGLNRRTLLAANAATQLLFLLAYVLVQR